MRTLLVLVALLAAGCTNPLAAEPEPVAPAAVPDAPAQEPSTEADPAAPAAAPTPAQASPPPAAPSPAPSTPAPPPAAPTPWELTGEARVGWLAAAGVGGAQAPSQGQADADHCPDATFFVPAGAKAMTLSISGQAASPDGAGTYIVRVTSANGTAREMTAEVDPASGGASAQLPVDAPAIGEWSLHAEPMGPAVQQVWTVSIAILGESVGPAPTLTVASGC